MSVFECIAQRKKLHHFLFSQESLSVWELAEHLFILVPSWSSLTPIIIPNICADFQKTVLYYI